MWNALRSAAFKTDRNGNFAIRAETSGVAGVLLSDEKLGQFHPRLFCSFLVVPKRAEGCL